VSLNASSWFKGEVCILVVALALRLGVALLLPMPEDFWQLSEPGWIAASLNSGRGYSFDLYGTRPDNPLRAFLPPLHPGMMALALQFARPNLALGLIQGLLGGLTVGMLMELTKGLAGRRVGLVAGWMGALYPAHVLVTSQPISVALLAFCMMSALLAVWRLKERPGTGRALAAGAMIGLYGLGRSSALLLAPIAVVWLELNEIRGRDLWRSTVVMLAAAGLVLLPWTLRNGRVLNWFMPTATNDGVTFWNGNNPFTTGSGHDVFADRLAAYQGRERDPKLPDVYEHPEPYPFPPEIEARLGELSELELRHAFLSAGREYIQGDPAGWLRLMSRKLLSFWWFRPNLGANPLYRDHWTTLYRLQYAVTLPLAGLGVGLALRRGLGRQVALIFAVLAYTSLVHVTFQVLTRYRWEIELLFLLFVALALEAGWRAWRREQQR
jgi:hypothetical protein